MSDVSKTSELIIEAQEHYSEMNGLNSRAAEVMMELVAALEAATRVPVQGEPNDDELAEIEAELASFCEQGHVEPWGEVHVTDCLGDMADWVAKRSRATVPDAATAAIAAVRAIHEPQKIIDVWGKSRSRADDFLVCIECTDPDASMAAPWPCATVAALDGAPEPEEKP